LTFCNELFTLVRGKQDGKSAMKNNLRHYRFLCSEMTQQDLADRCGVTRQTIIAVEKGAFNPSVKLALKMAAVLNTTVHELFVLHDED